MRKLTVSFFSLALALGLTACAGGNASVTEGSISTVRTTASASSAAPQESELPETSQSQNSEETGDTLVVYYSATGNTERVANEIAAMTGGELFELEPVDPYTDEDLNWTADGSRVNAEHDDESLRDVPLVANTVENWESYDTVFIGYPIWWGIAAWPVDSFIKANDFTGKTVIPFCTSASSGLGDSGRNLAEMAGTGDWEEGRRFSSGVSEADVRAWLDEIGVLQ